MAPDSTCLKIEGLTKSFGGLTAVNDFHMEVKEREIVSLIGPNGAGKTTIFNLISCFYRPDEGSIGFMGEPLNTLSPHQVCALGISRTFQTTRLFKQLNVLENLKVGTHCRSGYRLFHELLMPGRIRAGELQAEERVKALLAEFELDEYAHELAGNLPYGLQRMVEILRALASSPRLLMLDEPAAGMNPQEAVNLMAVIERIRKKNITVFLVEHNMDVVMEISDRIVVMNYGEKIAEGHPTHIQQNQEVIKAYLGEDIDDDFKDL